MRTVIARLTIVAACAVCLELLGALDTVALAQTPGTRTGGTTPGTMTPGTTSPGTQPGTTTPGTTTPGTGTSPGTTTPGTTPPGTTPGGGTTPGSGTGTGQTPSQAAADPFLTLLQAFFDAVQGFVMDEFPDASPEFQAWLTNALMDYLFGDMVSEYFFGGSAHAGFGGP